MKPLCTVIVYVNDDGSFHASADAVGLTLDTHKAPSLPETLQRCADVLVKHLNRKPIAGSEAGENP